jgi:ATP-dependent Clp protease ATP-binding subunit ClpA
VYNPDYGAREVRRYIIDNIEDLIAEKIINSGKKVFELEVVKGEIVIK